METQFPSSLHKLFHIFQSSLEKLGSVPSTPILESWSILVHEVMSARWRKFHTTEHIFDLSRGADPIESLAVIFHDIVYIQVDRRVHPKIKNLLEVFSIDEKYQTFLPKINQRANDPIFAHAGERNPRALARGQASLYKRNFPYMEESPGLQSGVLQIAYEVFGFEPQQSLNTMTGLNEFLSAIVAISLLSPYLSRWQIVQICACIEATIPFRAHQGNHAYSPFVLYERLKKANLNLKLSQTQTELEEAVKKSVRVSNRDIENFGSSNSQRFIGNTWKLVLEGNPIFKNPMHTVSQYRSALLKAENFFATLNPEVIFSSFQNEPEPKLYDQWFNQARLNLDLGVRYFQAKIVAAGFLESIALLSGGDAPMILLMGEIASGSLNESVRMERYLNQTIETTSYFDPKILELLESGWDDPSELNFKKSTLSSYLYPRLSESTRVTALENSKNYSKII